MTPQKIRMNTEIRNKVFNKIKTVFENESTQEREAFLQSRENVKLHYATAFETAKAIVERAYPKDDVAILRTFKKKYGTPCDVVAKDKCFYFAHTETRPLNEGEDNDDLQIKSHFDFGLFGNLNGNEHSYDDDKKHFAYAMFREEMKQENLNPDIIAQQINKGDNPYKTKHIADNDKFLGYASNHENEIGITKEFNDNYYLDVIGVSHCRSRAIACNVDEYNTLEAWRIAKASVVSKHQKWVDSIEKQCEQLKIGLKAYKYLSEAVELATALGINIDEAELLRTNSTGLIIYNPQNLASMIKGMKNTTFSREDKIKARLLYEQKVSVN
jgi:hypothetical protein